MMQPPHSIVSVAMPPGSREPVTKTPGPERAAPRTAAGSLGYRIYGMVTIGVPGGGAKVDGPGFAV